MSLEIKPHIKVDGKTHILCDAQLVDSPSADLFNVDKLKGQGVLEGTIGGRGASFIVRYPDRTWVLRHYRRGGIAGKVLNDQYFGLSREVSRSWSEWRLLYQLHQEGFPVPRPVAASYQPCFGFYRADLITEFLPGTESLAERLTNRMIALEVWEGIGACIARFHNRGVFHADLNAHNIMLDDDGMVFLLDFDKGKFLNSRNWCDSNVQRLFRSLTKLSSEREDFSFSLREWTFLLSGYNKFFLPR